MFDAEKEVYFKVCGVKPHQLAALHMAAKEQENALRELDIIDINPDQTLTGCQPHRVGDFIKILSSKLQEAGNEDYIVEIKILCGIDCYIKDAGGQGKYKKINLYPPISIMKAVFNALEIFPLQMPE